MGLFSCCTGDKKQAQNDSEARHARIVEIYAQAAYDAQNPTATPPPSYGEVTGQSIEHGIPNFVEKEPYQPPTQMVPQPSSPIPSPRTSICSIPSTRLTEITSGRHTGATSVTVGRQRNDESMRSSLVFDSAPPSYYDGRSIRERGRSPDSQRQAGDAPHPVTTEDWLEVLQRTAQAAENYIRRLERP